MEEAILISNLNDFVFCPVSVYFHNLFGNQVTISYQNEDQINGKKAHERVDAGIYSTKSKILSGIGVYSEEYGLVGKIDIYDGDEKTLIERKRTIKTIFDGYVYQLYAQYLCMSEMGYEIEKLFLYSMTDNRKYPILLPEDDLVMFDKFKKLINNMREFSFDVFEQSNRAKCARCIYEPACDRGLKC